MLVHVSGEFSSLQFVKLALMYMDTASNVLKDQGLKILDGFTDTHNFIPTVRESGLLKSIRVSGDKNYVHDLALYRLGEYYWLTKNFKLARNYWNRLTLQYGKSTKTPSVWANKVTDKLKLIESK